MRWPRPPRPVRRWLRRWALDAVRALDAWEDEPAAAGPSGAPQVWLQRVRAAPGVDWLGVGAERPAANTAEPHRLLTFSAERPAVLAASAPGTASPRRQDTLPALVFSARPPATDARPVFPERPPTAPVVRTEVREVRSPAPSRPGWGPPAPGTPPAPLRWPEVPPTPAPPPWLAAAPDGTGPAVPTWPDRSEPTREPRPAWPQTPSSAAPTTTFPPAAATPSGSGWPAAPDDSSDDWPDLPTPAPDVVDLFHAAQREQERWRELEREQAGERWNG